MNSAVAQSASTALAAPLAQAQGGAVTLTIQGLVLLFLFVGIGAYLGYMRGVRALLTVAVGTTLAYLLTVRGGEEVFGVFNRVWSNLPRFAGIALNRPEWTSITWDPLLGTFINQTLAVRMIVFIGIIILSFVLNKAPKWYSGSPAGHEPLAKPLGMLAGGIIALLWTNAAVVFYQIAEAGGTFFSGILGNLLRAIPDLGIFILVPVGLLFGVLALIVLVRLQYLVTVPPAPQKK